MVTSLAISDSYRWSMMFPDLPSPAEASSQTTNSAKGFAQAGNRFPLFGIMLLLILDGDLLHAVVGIAIDELEERRQQLALVFGVGGADLGGDALAVGSSQL